MIRVERIQADIAAIAAITQTPGNGATRPTFSREWGQARDYVIDEAKKIGCTARIDASGNTFLTPTAVRSAHPTWLCGSHVDTVPNGGDYDGVAGVVTALELLRSAHDDGITLPLTLVIFAEEEGPTFGLGMLGSRALIGELTADQLGAMKNKEGQTYLEAGAPFGVNANQIAASRLRTENHLAHIELHIEQGPGMWRRDQRLAIVTAIAGRKQFRIVLHGEANHAGATSMADRRDALAGAAEIIVGLEKLTTKLSPSMVITVGRLDVSPNAINVIPERVEFTIDCRAGDSESVIRGVAEICELVNGIADRRGLRVEQHGTEFIEARPMSPALVDALQRSASIAGLGVLPTTVSGALHDSAVLAPHLPTVMLFVPSRDGISHNSAEFSRVEDIAAGARMIEQLVRRPTLAMLNAMDRDAFVNAIGAMYEHSPWIAQRAWSARPFATIDALANAMSDVVRRSTRDEQLSLIRAHPDLVSRMTDSPSRTREGAGGRGNARGCDIDSRSERPPPQPSLATGEGSDTLTRESLGEQRAAGLTAISDEEIAIFDRYNAAYRERFGFPFVICARENKKDAILAAFPIRLANTVDAEISTALDEIDKIGKLRLADATWEASSS